MPKSVLPSSHEAIKRSLKSKFKLILSENRILVETINGYVKKAEKVYKDMEATDDVSPKQFAKAMEKLERAYSACVKLILVASDLFEKGETGKLKARDVAASSCESETSVFSSESSTTLNSNRARKAPTEKGSQRRSKSSEIKLSDASKSKARDRATNRVSGGTIEVTDPAGVQTINASSERLFVRPGSCSEFDHLIELQRFLHGLEKEKLQSDHPSPCVAPEKKLTSSKSPVPSPKQNKKAEKGNKKASVEESPSSLSQRLKVLKNAIEHFSDRSSGNERVNQALSDIRELVIKSMDQTEKPGTIDIQHEDEDKGSLNSQTSPVSMSLSLEVRTEKENKAYKKDKTEQPEGCHITSGSIEKHDQTDLVKQNCQEFVVEGVKIHQGPAANSKILTEKQPQPCEKTPKIIQIQSPQYQPEQPDVTEQQQLICEKSIVPQKVTSPTSPGQGDNKNEDINQIIVNKIVDMVSAKLAPRLQIKNNENRSLYQQPRTENFSEQGPVKETIQFKQGSHSPSRLSCQEISFSQSLQQANYCGNYSSFQQLYHNNPQQHEQRQIQEYQKSQRRQQRPKMVSFVEDYDRVGQYGHWTPRYESTSRQFAIDSSPSDVGGTSLYEDREVENPQNYQNQQSNRFSSPHKKRIYSIQQTGPAQRCLSQFQQQQCLPELRRRHGDEDNDENDIEAEVDKDENESELADESDSDEVEDLQQNQQDLHLNSTPSQESPGWGDRTLPKTSPAFETLEYRNMHQMQRGQQQPQQSQQLPSSSHHHEPFTWQVPGTSPTAENYKLSHDSQDREWYTSPQAPMDSNTEEKKVRQDEGDGPNILQHRYIEDIPHEQCQGDYPEWQGISPDTLFNTNDGWTHRLPSPKQSLAHSHQQTELPRQFPVKMQRTSSGLGQVHQQMNTYTSFGKNQCGYTKYKSSEAAPQTATDSSGETSPVFNTDERIYKDTTTCTRDMQEGNEPKPTRLEGVSADSKQMQGDASRTVTLSNLPLDLQESELLNILKSYGHVTKIYYIKDRNTGGFQGRAFGKYSKPAEAYEAVKALQSLAIDGHEVSVQLYLHKP